MTNMKRMPQRGEKTEALIIDLGGVLLNLDLHRSIVAFKELGFDEVDREITRLFEMNPEKPFYNLFHLYESGQMSSRRFRDEIRKYSENIIEDDDIDRAWTAMLLDLHQENINIVERLKGSFRLFMLSNTNAIHIETLNNCPVRGKDFQRVTGLFEKTYYSHEVGMRKPDREIFEHVISDAVLDPEKTLFIDDSADNINGAGKSGLQTWHHKAGESLKAIFTAHASGPPLL